MTAAAVKDYARGERIANAKLTVEQVREIRASNSPRSALAHAYEVSPTTIWLIRQFKLWSHVR